MLGGARMHAEGRRGVVVVVVVARGGGPWAMGQLAVAPAVQTPPACAQPFCCKSSLLGGGGDHCSMRRQTLWPPSHEGLTCARPPLPPPAARPPAGGGGGGGAGQGLEEALGRLRPASGWCGPSLRELRGQLLRYEDSKYDSSK